MDVIWKFDKRILSHFDFPLIVLIIPIVSLSGMLIAEVVPALAQKHIVYVTLSLAIFIFIFLLPIRRLTWLIPLFYWFNIILLLAVEFFGHTRLGAKRWLDIPLINFTIQPSELIKPAFVMMLAYLIVHNPPPRGGYGLMAFTKLSLFILLPFFLIAKEPDLGTATVLLLLGFGILFVVGVQWKIWVGLLTLFLLSLPLVYSQLHDYQKKRLTDFIAEKPSYHVQQSIIAIGSGGVFGKSKNDATQTQMRFLPIATSDFIFAYIVERFGFVGALMVIFLYAVIVLHLSSIGLNSDDYYIKVVAMALALLFFIYMSVNIAMTIGLAPVVGVPLPMFSYGGSSFVNFVIIIAILENLLSFRFQELYDNRGTKSFL